MLKQQLQKDLNESLKIANRLKRAVLGMVMTAIKNKEILKRQQLSKNTSDVVELEKQSQLTDEEIMDLLAGEIKKRKESAEQFKLGGREELSQKELSEIEILLAYLPEQLDEKTIRTEVQKIITELGASSSKDIGRVIGATMTKLKGRIDGGMASKIIKELLQ
ncbi:MAG: GatB/YqeY domain-containing protein [Patescibacteria group bacterium]